MAIVEGVRRELMGLSDSVQQRTRRRLDGLTDEEYRWEPVPLSWSVRPLSGGAHRADGAVWPQFPPFTTLAWRLWHLTCCYGQSRNARLLGLPVPADDRFAMDRDAPATAPAAVQALDDAAGVWRSLLESLTDGDLDAPMGPVAGGYAEQRKVGYVLHMLDEFIHHGAEIGVLRDFFRARRAADEADPLVVALLEGDRRTVDAIGAGRPGRIDDVRSTRPDLLGVAIRNGYWRAVPLLLDLGFPVPEEGDEELGATPLHWAAGSGSVEVVALLLDRGADPTATDRRFGADVRGWAEYYGRSEVIALLNEREAQLEA